MIDRLSRILFRLRYVVWLAILPMTVASWMLVPPIEFDQSIEGFFPPDHPALLSYERSKRAFGGDQIVFVAYDDPQLWTVEGMDRVRNLADRITNEVPDIERVDAVDQMPVPWRVDAAVGAVLGIMGWLGVKIDMSTALVAGVAIGLSVDDAVHCLLRWQQEMRAGRPAHEALEVAYAGTGPGVVLSSSAVSLGFLAMVFSEFVPMSSFGWLVAVATAGGSLGNLVVIPAVLALTVRPSGQLSTGACPQLRVTSASSMGNPR